MRRLIPLLLALLPMTVEAQPLAEIDWQLLAIDGRVTDMRASLRLGADGTVTGAAPCNRWAAANTESLPALNLPAIRATRMACDKLADENRFFEALRAMTRLTPEGDSALVLTGPDGRSMEFVRDRTDPATPCLTCQTSD
jgi:heat shock protein HslJ